MSTRSNRRWTAQEKLAILEAARQPGAMVSDVCRRHVIATAQFYLWEKQARQGALEALRPGPPGPKLQNQEGRLQAEVARLQLALGELALENLQLKKGR